LLLYQFPFPNNQRIKGLVYDVNTFNKQGLRFWFKVFFLNKTFISTFNHQTIILYTFYNPSFVYVISVFALNSLYSQGQQPRLLLLNNFYNNTINLYKINTELLFGLKNKISP
jgi:hypothetical protein